MKITIESTPVLTRINGVDARLWEGTTERGVRCKVFVHCIAVHVREDQGAFERELKERAQPRELDGPRAIDLRHIL
jgi:hypothetical protein